MSNKNTITLNLEQVYNCRGGQWGELNEKFWEIRNSIHELLATVLGRFLSLVDPNWHHVSINFVESNNLNPDDRKMSDVFQLKEASVNGPKYGDVNIPVDIIYAILPSSILAALRSCVDYHNDHVYWFEIHNPEHKLELINEQTIIHFENCTTGVVQNYDPNNNTFEVRYLDGHFYDKNELPVEEYDLQKLLAEFEDDGLHCQAVGVSYKPSELPPPILEAAEEVKICPQCGKWSCTLRGKHMFLGIRKTSA